MSLNLEYTDGTKNAVPYAQDIKLMNEQRTGEIIASGESELMDKSMNATTDTVARQAGITVFITKLSSAVLSTSSKACLSW